MELLREALPRLENYRNIRGKSGHLSSLESSLSELQVKLKSLESLESTTKQRKSSAELKLKFMENVGVGGLITKADIEKLIATLAIRGGSENIEAALVEVWNHYVFFCGFNIFLVNIYLKIYIFKLHLNLCVRRWMNSTQCPVLSLVTQMRW
jgi:hypothetical protein